MTFKDHFSVAASGYAAHRPIYPLAVAEALAVRSPARGLAWERLPMPNDHPLLIEALASAVRKHL